MPGTQVACSPAWGIFAIGQSPFRTKGLGYLGHMAFVEAHLPGGLSAQQASLDDPQLSSFFEQRFVAGGWYDVRPLAAAGEVCARLRDEPLQVLLNTRAKHQVERDLTGVLGFIARFTSQGLIARAVLNASQRYFDFMDVSTAAPADNHVIATIDGIPDALATWSAVLMQSYAQATFEHIGHDDGTVRARRTGTRGEKHGVATAQIEVDIRWQ